MEPDFEEDYKKTGHSVIIIVNVFILIIGKYLFFNWVRKFNIERDEKLITPSDFTVLMKGLPKT